MALPLAINTALAGSCGSGAGEAGQGGVETGIGFGHGPLASSRTGVVAGSGVNCGMGARVLDGEMIGAFVGAGSKTAVAALTLALGVAVPALNATGVALRVAPVVGPHAAIKNKTRVSSQ